jgi:hypothetical protein
MRFSPPVVFLVPFVAASSLVSIPAVFAQVSPPVSTIDAREGPSGESAGEPIPAQTQPNTGAKGGQHVTTRQPASAPDPLTANISGTVTDTNGDVVPGASVTLEDEATSAHQTVVASDSGGFQFARLKPGIPYQITIAAQGFDSWKSAPLTLDPGQYLLLQDIKLKLPGAVTSVTVYATREQIATQQVIVEEHQRVFGILPNFYVTYDENPVPLTTKLKFRLAYKADSDIVTFVGVAFMAALYQAGDIPDYGQGWDAYGKRVAAGYADTTTDIFIGGAILPWLLHQDPRYYYQGKGTKSSRFRHAVFSPFVCKGDNGKTQPNYSSVGGDLASGAISNLYYPESNRGASLLFQGFAITTGVRMVNGLLQEFLLRKLTPSARQPK